MVPQKVMASRFVATTVIGSKNPTTLATGIYVEVRGRSERRSKRSALKRARLTGLPRNARAPLESGPTP